MKTESIAQKFCVGWYLRTTSATMTVEQEINEVVSNKLLIILRFADLLLANGFMNYEILVPRFCTKWLTIIEILSSPMVFSWHRTLTQTAWLRNWWFFLTTVDLCQLSWMERKHMGFCSVRWLAEVTHAWLFDKRAVSNKSTLIVSDYVQNNRIEPSFLSHWTVCWDRPVWQWYQN